MGQFCSTTHHNMKVLLIVALAAAAMAEPEAEADPAVLYANFYGGLGHYGYGYGLAGYYGYPGYYRGLVGGHSGYPYNYGWTDGPNNGVGGVPVAAVAPVAAYAHPLHYGYG